MEERENERGRESGAGGEGVCCADCSKQLLMALSFVNEITE
jgi:hypothetical protein